LSYVNTQQNLRSLSRATNSAGTPITRIVKRGEPDSPEDIGAASYEEINHSVEEMWISQAIQHPLCSFPPIQKRKQVRAGPARRGRAGGDGDELDALSCPDLSWRRRRPMGEELRACPSTRAGEGGARWRGAVAFVPQSELAEATVWLGAAVRTGPGRVETGKQ
jgi:hypothetical protein